MKKIIISLSLLIFCAAAFAQDAYKNSSLSPQKRAEDLLKKLTLKEKVGLMIDAAKPVDRLGIKTYNWWNEALHGVARAGLATVFPQPVGMAASFDDETVNKVFSAVSDEARAKSTRAFAEGSRKRYQGLTMWTPTVNIFRDPRWGRGMESYGEDPYLTSVMGVAVVKGLQGPENSKYDKLHACAKHFAVHSGPEWNRHSFDARDIAPRELWETYLPPFKALVQDAGVKEVMCAYNRFEGEPCCGSNQLLVQILRGNWKYDGIIVADCGAVSDFFRPNGHQTHENVEAAAADAVLKGTDLDCGSSYNRLAESVRRGMITEKDIDVSVCRLLKARFELGEMDDPSKVEWTKIPYSVVASAKHNDLALDIARKSMVLLQNKNDILPLKRGGLKIAVMGPNADDSLMQWGNYNGTPSRTITILEGIKSALKKNDKLIYEQGCGLVETTLFKSTFDRCKSSKGNGFDARYWNNREQSGAPVATANVSTPFRFCTSGATVFAPNVKLTDFSASYTSKYTPDKTGIVFFDFYGCGEIKLIVNGKEVKRFHTGHGARKFSHQMRMEAGKPYDLEIKFAYTMGDALLNFDLGYKNNIDITASIEKVMAADIVIFVGGISPFVEGEEMGVNLPGFKGGDRTDIELPYVQREFIKALNKMGKKVIFVNCSGSPIALEPEAMHCEAVLQAWYPGQAGGKAVADVLFGDYNPAGRLPVTFYRNTAQLPDFEDYNMKGRTYRYMTQAPLFPFGYGLSYTSFQYGKPKLDKKTINAGESVTLTVPVTNTGKRNGDEVVQVYLSKKDDKGGPIKTLRAFKRVNIPTGKTIDVSFELSGQQLEWWNDKTMEVKAHAGNYELFVGGSSKTEDLQGIKITVR